MGLRVYKTDSTVNISVTFLLVNLQDLQNLVKYSLFLFPPHSLLDEMSLICLVINAKVSVIGLSLHFTRIMKISKGMCTTLSSASHLFR